jgi:tetratricopeptide (TPR) repeat protein
VTGWFWYLVTLVPVTGLVQVGSQGYADRYTYVPLVGLFVLLAWVADDVAERYPTLRGKLAIAAVVVLCVLALVTQTTVSYWRDDISLFGRAVVAGQRNYATLGNLGNALGNRGQAEEGMSLLRESLAMRPGDGRTLMSMGALLVNNNRPAEAVEYYKRSLSAEPRMKEANAGMAVALLKLGRADEAMEYARRAVECDSLWSHGYNVLGMALADSGRLDEAVAAIDKAIALNPGVNQFYQNMATVCYRKGDLEGAIKACTRLAAKSPDWRAHSMLGTIHQEQGNYQAAEKDFAEAIRLAPRSAEAHYRLALLFARTGRRSEAVAEAERAMALLPRGSPLVEDCMRVIREAGGASQEPDARR